MRRYLFFGLILLFSFLVACNEGTGFSSQDDSGNDGGDTNPNVTTYSISSGWAHFDAKRYNYAIANFEGIIKNEDGNFTSDEIREANIGMGMCTLAMKGDDYRNKAGIYFSAAADTFDSESEYYSDLDNWTYVGLLTCGYDQKNKASSLYKYYPLYQKIDVRTWSFSHNNGDIVLDGKTVHTMCAQMFINLSNGTDEDGNGKDDALEKAVSELKSVIDALDGQALPDNVKRLKEFLEEKGFSF